MVPLDVRRLTIRLTRLLLNIATFEVVATHVQLAEINAMWVVVYVHVGYTLTSRYISSLRSYPTHTMQLIVLDTSWISVHTRDNQVVKLPIDPPLLH